MPRQLALPSARFTVPNTSAFVMCPANLSAAATQLLPHPMYAIAYELAQRQVAAEKARRTHLASLN